MNEETLESGALLPVLRRATHEDLNHIVAALNKGWDVFITWDERYKSVRDDLTKNPEFIAEQLCRAGGHSLANLFRGAGVAYGEIVRDVCRAVRVKQTPKDNNVIGLEAALLQAQLEKALKGMGEAERDELERKIRDMAGRELSLADILTGGAQFASFLPLAFSVFAETAALKAAPIIGDLIAARLGLSILGPIGLAFGTMWMANDFAGPSLRATIPAVTCVALLRQRMILDAA